MYDIFTYIWRIVILIWINIPNIESIVIISFSFPTPSKQVEKLNPMGMVN